MPQLHLTKLGSIEIGVPVNVDIYCSLRSIGIGVPINEDICCSSNVLYQIENQLSECAVLSKSIIRCQGSITIAVPIKSTVVYQIENQLSECAVQS